MKRAAQCVSFTRKPAEPLWHLELVALEVGLCGLEGWCNLGVCRDVRTHEHSLSAYQQSPRHCHCAPLMMFLCDVETHPVAQPGTRTRARTRRATV